MAGTYKNKAYTLRLPNELREKVEEIARAERRPVNTQYEIIVSDWLKWYDAKQGGGTVVRILKICGRPPHGGPIMARSHDLPETLRYGLEYYLSPY